MAFVYKIKNILNNKSYIGWTSKTVDFRWNEHKSDALKFRDNRKFYNAIRKYGTNSWDVTTLCEVENKEDALKKEIEFIVFYDSYNNGYNSTLGGDGNNGIIMSDEQIKKSSLTRRSLNKEQYDLMCKLRSDGLITKEIAKIIGTSNDIVKKWIHKSW